MFGDLFPLHLSAEQEEGRDFYTMCILQFGVWLGDWSVAAVEPFGVHPNEDRFQVIFNPKGPEV